MRRSSRERNSIRSCRWQPQQPQSVSAGCCEHTLVTSIHCYYRRRLLPMGTPADCFRRASPSVSPGCPEHSVWGCFAMYLLPLSLPLATCLINSLIWNQKYGSHRSFSRYRTYGGWRSELKSLYNRHFTTEPSLQPWYRSVNGEILFWHGENKTDGRKIGGHMASKWQSWNSKHVKVQNLSILPSQRPVGSYPNITRMPHCAPSSPFIWLTASAILLL